MISPEQRAEIRRLYYAKHARVATIATTLRVRHDTVRHAIEPDRFIRPGAQIRPSALDPYKPFVLATLEQYPRLRATRLYEMLGARGYAGSVVQVRRWVRTVRPAARAEAYLRLETLPGEQGQVDWGNFGALPIGRARRVRSLEDLNAQLARWIAEVAHARPLPGSGHDQLVREALAAEQPRLLPLPAHPFACELVRPAVSGKTPYLRFDGNDYSIPHALVRRPLTLVVSETLLRVLDGVTEVACHGRSYDRSQQVEEPAHLAALAREKRRAHELRGRDRLRALCPEAEPFLDALARRGEPLASHTTALLRLLDQYGASALNAALRDALRRGAVSAPSVAHLLDQRARARRQPPPLTVVLPPDPRVRDLRVTPHPLAAYDALLTPPPDEEPSNERPG